MHDNVETVIIGAGVVGLAIGRALAKAGHEVIVLERHAGIGEETSSRNSEVIHAGIYYAAGSLKARLCVEGKERLYEYCEAKGIAHRRCGKVIIAAAERQWPDLHALGRRAAANGVADLEWLRAEALAELEPAVRGSAGLWSPSTGIVDGHALMLALHGDVEAAGGIVALRSEFRGGVRERDRIRLTIQSADETSDLRARRVINAAGLHATTVAHTLEGLSMSGIPVTRYAKGAYFVYNGTSPFNHLVYPLPEDGGLGVHATLDLAGRARFGPDVRWIDRIDYAFDETTAPRFYAAVRQYWPELPDDSLSPGYTGIRPKVTGPGEPPGDFVIRGWTEPGGPALVQLFGIESPGLTAALAIAEHVRGML